MNTTKKLFHALITTTLSALALLSASPALAAQADTVEAAPRAEPAMHKWSVEIDAIQPFIPTVGIIRPKVTRTLWGTPKGFRGDLVLGAWIRPHITHDVVKYIDEYMGSVGYRQYFWRGLHAETILDAGAAWGTNLFDGKFYRTATLFLDVNVGYRFGFFEPGGLVEGSGKGVGFFVAPQAGMLTSLGVANIGPRNGKPDVFAQGSLLVGASF